MPKDFLKDAKDHYDVVVAGVPAVVIRRLDEHDRERDTIVNVYSTTKGMTAICAHQLIEQGKIGMILSGKPQDRRKLIEEAAGITRYKARKRVAEIFAFSLGRFANSRSARAENVARFMVGP